MSFQIREIENIIFEALKEAPDLRPLWKAHRVVELFACFNSNSAKSENCEIVAVLTVLTIYVSMHGSVILSLGYL